MVKVNIPSDMDIWTLWTPRYDAPRRGIRVLQRNKPIGDLDIDI